MSVLKILIVEDDLILAEDLSERLVGLGYVISDIVTNQKEAIEAFKKRLPDVVLMDIDLGNNQPDGIQTALKLNQIVKVPIIFLTGLGGEENIKRAKEVDPVYYLIKPITDAELQIAFDIGLLNYVKKKRAEVEVSLQASTTPPCLMYSEKNIFFVKHKSRYVKININDVLYIKGDSPGNYLSLHTEDQTYTLSTGLKSFGEQVKDNSLMRVHKSYILNLNKVSGFDKGRAFVIKSKEQIEIPIGATYREIFQDRFIRVKAD